MSEGDVPVAFDFSRDPYHRAMRLYAVGTVYLCPPYVPSTGPREMVVSTASYLLSMTAIFVGFRAFRGRVSERALGTMLVLLVVAARGVVAAEMRITATLVVAAMAAGIYALFCDGLARRWGR